MAQNNFQKTEPLCGDVFLIDENLCLKNSYPIINYNVASLSANLRQLNLYGNDFNVLYNNFAANSARWITAITNWETLSAGWLDAETVVYNLSSYWQKEVNLIYATPLNLETYLNPANTTSINNQIRTWLIQNFNNTFAENQIINVDLYLTHNFVFNWSFYYSYYENCVPPNASFTGNCECPRPSHSCNAGTIDGVPFRGCRNAGASCRIDANLTYRTGTENIFCPNFNAGLNTINYVKNLTDDATETLGDQTTARIFKLKFRIINNTFQLI